MSSVRHPVAADIADRLALRDLVDRYATAVDRRDLEAQQHLFTPGARVRLYPDGAGSGPSIFERDGIFQVLDTSRFASAMHVNGQATFELGDDRATGEVYAMAYLIAGGAERKTITTTAVRYLDRYARTESGWAIESRDIVIEWNETRPFDG